MHLDWTTVALQAINILILCWLLRRFLYRPILGTIDARRQLVERKLAEAATAESKAKTQLLSLEAERSRVVEDRNRMLAAVTERSEDIVKARLEEAQSQAAAMLQEARRAIAAERVKALEDAKAATLDLAVGMAVRLLAASPAAVRASAWLELIEQHLAGLAPEERESLSRQLGPTAPLQVVTADSLPEELHGLWQQRLGGALASDAQLAFAVDPDLVGGAELRFSGAILRFSWQDALDNLRSQLEKADAAG